MHHWMLDLDLAALCANLLSYVAQWFHDTLALHMDLQLGLSSWHACICWGNLCFVVSLVLCLWPSMNLIYQWVGSGLGWAHLHWCSLLVHSMFAWVGGWCTAGLPEAVALMFAALVHWCSLHVALYACLRAANPQSTPTCHSLATGWELTPAH